MPRTHWPGIGPRRCARLVYRASGPPTARILVRHASLPGGDVDDLTLLLPSIRWVGGCGYPSGGAGVRSKGGRRRLGESGLKRLHRRRPCWWGPYKRLHRGVQHAGQARGLNLRSAGVVHTSAHYLFLAVAAGQRSTPATARGSHTGQGNTWIELVVVLVSRRLGTPPVGNGRRWRTEGTYGQSGQSRCGWLDGESGVWLSMPPSLSRYVPASVAVAVAVAMSVAVAVAGPVAVPAAGLAFVVAALEPCRKASMAVLGRRKDRPMRTAGN